MEENIGTLVLGTKVDGKGLEKGLKQIEASAGKTSDEFDEQLMQLEGQKDIYVDINDLQKDVTGELGSQTKEIEQQAKQYDQIERKLKNIKGLKSDGASAWGLGEELPTKTKFLGSSSSSVDLSSEETGQMLEDMEGIEAEGSIIGSVISTVMGKIGKFAGKVLDIVGQIVWDVLRVALEIGGITVGISTFATILAVVVKAIQKIMDENKQLIANIKYIAFLVTKMIENIANAITGQISNALNTIVSIVYTIIVLVGQLLSWLFKIDVFAGTTKQDFEDWNKNIQGASAGLDKATGSAKDLKKQLAGFDEMNVLQEPTSGGSSGGGGGGVDLPLPDLKEIGEIKVPKWLQWIIDNADIISGVFAMIGGAILAFKLGLDPLKGLAIGSILAGIVNLIIDIIDFAKDPTWENFKSLIDDFLIDLALIIGGIALLTGQWIPGVIAIVMLLVGIIIRYWNDIKAMLSKAWDWINENVVQPIANAFMWLWDKIVDIFSPVINFVKMIGEAVWNVVSTIWENIKITIDNIKKIVEFLWNALMVVLTPIFKWIKANIIDPVWNVISWIIDKIVAGFNTLVGIIKKIFTPVIDFFKGIIDTIWTLIKKIATTVADVISGAFKAVVNGVLGAIEGVLNGPIRAINKLIDTINKVPGLSLTRLNTFNLPRLAVGGIINQPGRGVPIGGAMVGESGREGILPLTDRRAMQELGQEIGKWITINATIPVSIGNRQVVRILQEINSDREFAMNS